MADVGLAGLGVRLVAGCGWRAARVHWQRAAHDGLRQVARIVRQQDSPRKVNEDGSSRVPPRVLPQGRAKAGRVTRCALGGPPSPTR
ncbi:hypothetical protein DIPPA_19760 [Diplonema papillatum]|nr:hypothetical protein DIPPA_19760 [Diplonema papillatum]